MMEDERIITPLPKSLPVAAVILLLLGIVLSPFIPKIFTEEQLSRNALLSGIPFVLITAAIILFFMSFIWWLSNRLNFRVSEKAYQLIEKITIGGIVLGIILMFQPWVFVLFRYGFYLLLFSTLAFMVWSHVTAAAPIDENAADLVTD
jgi:H+/Cl- antiporter ClcA